MRLIFRSALPLFLGSSLSFSTYGLAADVEKVKAPLKTAFYPIEFDASAMTSGAVKRIRFARVAGASLPETTFEKVWSEVLKTARLKGDTSVYPLVFVSAPDGNTGWALLLDGSEFLKSGSLASAYECQYVICVRQSVTTSILVGLASAERYPAFDEDSLRAVINHMVKLDVKCPRGLALDVDIQTTSPSGALDFDIEKIRNLLAPSHSTNKTHEALKEGKPK